ncbi:hypothetical protein CCP3SC15_2670001 [Gammaproteobacteria bacterium]
MLYGQAQLILEQFDAAQASFAEALKFGSVEGAARVGLARVALAQNDLERAEAEVTQALTADAEQVEAWLVKAEILRLRAKPAAAEESFTKAIALDPRNLSARLGKAAMELAQHQLDAADGELQRAAQIVPQHLLLNRLRGLLAYERGDLIAMEEVLNQILTIDQKESPATLLSLLGALIKRELQAGHHQAVLLAARRLQRQAPMLALGYATEGTIRMVQQDWGGAARALEAAYQREPSGLLALDLYAARSNQGENGAASVLENWFIGHPKDIETQLAAAISLQQNGQLQSAQAYYEKILETQPNHPLALNNLAWLYLEKHDQRALAMAKRAYQLAPNDPQVLDTYGWILANEGYRLPGLFLLQRAVSGAPRDGDIRYHLAATLDQAGRQEDAHHTVRQLLNDLTAFPLRPTAQALLVKFQTRGYNSDEID